MSYNTILIKNASILTSNNVYKNRQSILIKDTKIEKIAPEIDEDNVDKIIDASDK